MSHSSVSTESDINLASRVQAGRHAAQAVTPGSGLNGKRTKSSSDKRDYLRIRREEISYDLCVAPFANTLFVSSWLCKRPQGFLETCLSIPGLRVVTAGLLQLFKPATYYRVDSVLIVQGAIHNTVLAILDEKTTAQGLDPIP